MRGYLIITLCACLALACALGALCEERAEPDVVGANTYQKKGEGAPLDPFTADDAKACLSFGGVERLSDYVDAVAPAECEWAYAADSDATRVTLTGLAGSMTVELAGAPLGAQDGRMIGAPDGDVLMSMAALVRAVWADAEFPLEPPRGVNIGHTLDQVMAAYGVTSLGEAGALYEVADAALRGYLDTGANGEAQFVLEAGEYRLTYEFADEKVSAITLEAL